ncbi:MAG: hypothetical protein E7676_07455 [Ruminococcaceae bacterium]|nr:hypothetical protein [Oscillospiraceae bacterium]
MTIQNFAKQLEFKPLCMPSPEKEVEGVYIGDLLSWVMGKAESGNVWITIMSNINIVAVAALTDVSAILLSENVELDADVLKTAESKGINILSTPLSTYESAAKIAGVIS